MASGKIAIRRPKFSKERNPDPVSVTFHPSSLPSADGSADGVDSVLALGSIPISCLNADTSEFTAGSIGALAR
ncbi:MAG: hypothetical protein VXY82_07895 [Planctomycetota bacterium]|nr:hypothetical protein [Planctomycetota bacterium]